MVAMLLPQAVILLALVAPQAPTDRPAADADRIVREVLARGRYQTELPGAAECRTGSGGEAGDRTSRRPEHDAEGGRPIAPEESMRIRDDGSSFLLWGLLAFAVVAGLAMVIGRARGHHRDVVPIEPRRPATPAVRTPSADALAEAERLASEGRYAEAVRALLVGAFAALVERGAGCPKSATSREILATARVAEPARGGLRALVEAEERCIFALRPASPDDFAACAAAYRALQRPGPERAA
jgi:hypothetical protein